MENQKKVFTFALYLDGSDDLVQIKVIAYDEECARAKVNMLLRVSIDASFTGLYLNDVENY